MHDLHQLCFFIRLHVISMVQRIMASESFRSAHASTTNPTKIFAELKKILMATKLAKETSARLTCDADARMTFDSCIFGNFGEIIGLSESGGGSFGLQNAAIFSSLSNFLSPKKYIYSFQRFH